MTKDEGAHLCRAELAEQRLAVAVKALRPFAEIGQWLGPRKWPPEARMVHVHLSSDNLDGLPNHPTEDDFRHAAALTKPEQMDICDRCYGTGRDSHGSPGIVCWKCNGTGSIAHTTLPASIGLPAEPAAATYRNLGSYDQGVIDRLLARGDSDSRSGAVAIVWVADLQATMSAQKKYYENQSGRIAVETRTKIAELEAKLAEGATPLS